ncbi:hypothetical protein VNO77_27672 [Canavalia gladiata]|uniref:Uncharacterized protein n=1 Tax=Canavalia gladiata TaxID=3824 RepID=A0AAN9KV55_CANGL
MLLCYARVTSKEEAFLCGAKSLASLARSSHCARHRHDQKLSLSTGTVKIQRVFNIEQDSFIRFLSSLRNEESKDQSHPELVLASSDHRKKTH